MSIKSLAVLLCGLSLCTFSLAQDEAGLISLPNPRETGTKSLEQVLAARRSVREFAPAPLALADLGQLLWAAQGVTSDDGHRTAPSAGSTYPLELFAIVQRVRDLPPGVYHYHPGPRPGQHALEAVSTENPAPVLNLAVGQKSVAEGAVTVVFASVTSRIARKYGERAERYALLEAGHAAQNLLLEAVSLGLGAVPMGSFQEQELQVLLQTEATPLYLINVGKPRS